MTKESGRVQVGGGVGGVDIVGENAKNECASLGESEEEFRLGDRIDGAECVERWYDGEADGTAGKTRVRFEGRLRVFWVGTSGREVEGAGLREGR